MPRINVNMQFRTYLYVVRQGSNSLALEMERDSTTEVNARQLVLDTDRCYSGGERRAQKVHRRRHRVRSDVEKPSPAKMKIVKYVIWVVCNVTAGQTEVGVDSHDVTNRPRFDYFVGFPHRREKSGPHPLHDEDPLFFRLVGLERRLQSRKRAEDAEIGLEKCVRESIWSKGRGMGGVLDLLSLVILIAIHTEV